MELNVYNRTREKGYALYKKYFIQILNKTIEVLQLSDNISVSVIETIEVLIEQLMLFLLPWQIIRIRMIILKMN